MIYVNDNVRIRRRDEFNLVLEEYREKINRKNNTSKMAWSFVGYYDTLTGALRGAVDLLSCKLCEDDEEIININDVIDKIKNIKIDVNEESI